MMLALLFLACSDTDSDSAPKGSGITEVDFELQFFRLVCETMTGCFQMYETVEECLVSLDSEPYTCDEYDDTFAVECLRLMEQTSCEDWLYALGSSACQDTCVNHGT